MKTQSGAVSTLVKAIRMMAAFVALFAQIGIVGAGVMDGREGASAASHLESGGTNLHFAHNEADCFMCLAQHLGDALPFHAPPVRQNVEIVREVIAVQFHAVAAAAAPTNTSRAPPSIV